jgi:hypothetical protein
MSSTIGVTATSRSRRATISRGGRTMPAPPARAPARSLSRTSTSSSTSPGTTLIAPGRARTTPTVPTVVPLGDLARRALEGDHRLGGAGQRVAAQAHRRGARVGGRATEGQAEVVRRGDGGHHADLLALGLEDDALLDVQLDQRVHAGRVDARLGQPIGIEAGLGSAAAMLVPSRSTSRSRSGALELARRRAAADAAGAEARLLAGPAPQRRSSAAALRRARAARAPPRWPRARRARRRRPRR